MKKHIIIITAIAISISSLSNALALDFSLTGPYSQTSVNEGDDYFTDVLNDPMDFDKRRDILWEEQFDESSITVSNGVWAGATVGSAAIFPVYQGPHGPGATIAHSASVGNVGISYPINAGKYTSLSLISSLSDQSQRSIKAIAWTKGYENPSFSDTAVQKYIWNDSYNTNTVAQVYHGSNENILDIIDLSAHAAWNDKITGLAYDQSPAASAGTTESYSMFRIFDPDSAPYYTLTWSYTDLPEYAGGVHYPPQVSIYIDDDNSGLDGALLARVPVYNASDSQSLTSGEGSFTFPTAALPPGAHYFYLKLTDNVDNDSLIATSQYSAELSINAKPQITFNNPSYTSGEDYATSVLSNPWDFNNSQDIANILLLDADANKQFKYYVFENGYFQATAFIPTGPLQTETEAQLWLNTSFPIKTSKYRYLTFESEIDASGYGNIADKLGKGWMARISWFNEGYPEDGSITNDIVQYEGRNTYSVDLASVSLEHEETGLPNSGWNSITQATFLRLDPLETSTDTSFKIYDVKLTANPEPDYQSNKFIINFNLSDDETTPASIEFYSDTDNTGFDGSILGSAEYIPGDDLNFNFSTGDMPEGDYYIYAKVTDSSGSTSYTYADVPLTISTLSNKSSIIPYYRTYNPVNGEHFYTKSHLEYSFLGTVGWQLENIAYYIYESPVTIDGIAAKAWYRLYNPNDGLHHWTLSLAEYNQLGSAGWVQEGLVGYFFDQQVSGTVPLYRLYNPNNGVHHWTKAQNEYEFLIRAGWNAEGVSGYVFTGL